MKSNLYFSVFNTNSNQSVILTYNNTAYLNCTADDSDNGTFIYSSGTDRFNQALTIPVPLTIVGPNYFFSDTSDGVQCQHGLAFEIQVQRGIGLPPSLNQPPPPPYNEPPGPDNAQSPTVTVADIPKNGALSKSADVRVVVYGLGAVMVLLQFW